MTWIALLPQPPLSQPSPSAPHASATAANPATPPKASACAKPCATADSPEAVDVADAAAAVDAVDAVDAHDAAAQHIAQHIAHWALQFTPHVLLERAQLAHGPHWAVLLEVRASLRLWGGLRALLHTLAHDGQAIGVGAVAHGPTRLSAQAALWSGRPAVALSVAESVLQPPGSADGGAMAEPGPQPAPIGSLSLRWLPEAVAHRDALAHMGCTTWGQLQRMPRGGITRRFGAELLDALDRAYGLKPEAHAWLQASDVFEATLDLQTHVETAGALMFGAQRLLKLLQAWLRVRQQGVVACRWVWQFDARRDVPSHGEHTLHTAQPTQDIAHLQRLLHEQLQRVSLPAPVLRLRLHSLRTEPLAPQNHSLLPEDQLAGDPLHVFVERISAKLGPQAITSPELRADHRPERSHHSTAQHSSSPDAAPEHAWLMPTWLLPQPLKLLTQAQQPLYQGPLQLLHGPHRIETSALADAQPHAHSAVARDYFIAWSAHAGLLWIYQERSTTQADWYLQGLYA